MATNVITSKEYVRSAAGVWTPVGYGPGDLPMPSALRDPNTGRSSLVGTFAPLNVADLIGLVNTTFFTTTSITDNYTTANTGSATSTVNLNDGFAVLASGTTNPSTAQINSRDFATYNGIGELMFLNGLRVPQAGVAGCIRRWGAYDSSNGYFFEDNAGVLRVVSRKNGVDTPIASGSFNGLLGAAYTLDQNGHFFQILMTGGRAVFMIDQTTLHTLTTPAGQTTTSGSLNLGIRVEIVSTQATNMTLEIRGQNIGRLGPVDSKRLIEGLLDNQDSLLTRSVLSASTGAANTYVNPTGTALGTRNGLDVNLAGSSGGVPAVSQVISATVGNSPGVATTSSSTGQAIAAVGNSGNSTFHLVTTGFVGTLVFEASLDGGLNYAPVMAVREDGTGSESSTAISVAGPPFIRTYTTGVPGFTHLRVRCTAFTSGTLAVLINQGPFLLETNPSLAASAATIGTVLPRSSDLAVTATGAAAAAVTATLPAPAAGLFNYITSIEIQRYASAALTAGAAPIVVTSTNLPGTLAWSFDTAGAIGVSQVQQFSFANPLKSLAAATATTFVAPIATGVIWRMNITYYTGP